VILILLDTGLRVFELAQLRPRDPERRTFVARTACLFHRSEKTAYRQLAQLPDPKRCTRKDHSHARYPVEREFRRWIEIVAAIKLATLNRKGRHFSTLSMDNGPLAKSRVFHRLLAEKLGIEIKVHDAPQQGGRCRPAARSMDRRAVHRRWQTRMDAP
jgi:hypothetical protein